MMGVLISGKPWPWGGHGVLELIVNRRLILSQDKKARQGLCCPDGLMFYLSLGSLGMSKLHYLIAIPFTHPSPW
jgi:hypothetical protein